MHLYLSEQKKIRVKKKAQCVCRQAACVWRVPPPPPPPCFLYSLMRPCCRRPSGAALAQSDSGFRCLGEGTPSPTFQSLTLFYSCIRGPDPHPPTQTPTPTPAATLPSATPFHLCSILRAARVSFVAPLAPLPLPFSFLFFSFFNLIVSRSPSSCSSTPPSPAPDDASTLGGAGGGGEEWRLPF